MNKKEIYKLKRYYYQKLIELEKIRKNIVFIESYTKVLEVKKVIANTTFKYNYYDLLYRKEAKDNEVLERNESTTR